MSADPRGPLQVATKVEWTPQANLVTLACGHVKEGNATMSYLVGERYHCFSCEREAIACGERCSCPDPQIGHAVGCRYHRVAR